MTQFRVRDPEPPTDEELAMFKELGRLNLGDWILLISIVGTLILSVVVD